MISHFIRSGFFIDLKLFAEENKNMIKELLIVGFLSFSRITFSNVQKKYWWKGIFL